MKHIFGKRLGSLGLCLCLMLSLLPGTALAAGEVTVATSSLNKYICANGHAITLRAGATAGTTKIYLDSDMNNPVALTPPSGVTIEGDAANGYNLSECFIIGGAYNADVASTSITMEGGTVKNIYGGGYAADGTASARVTGNTAVTVGGSARVENSIFGGGYTQSSNSNNVLKVTVERNATITVQDNAYVKAIYGGGHSNPTAASAASDASVKGSATITVQDNATVENFIEGGGLGTKFPSSAGGARVNITGGSVGKVWDTGSGMSDGTALHVNISGGKVTHIEDSITLNVSGADSGKTLQYSKDGGTTWADRPEFTGLTPGTAYQFTVRYAGDDNHEPSPASAAATIYTVPAAPGEDAFTVTPESVNGRHDGSIAPKAGTTAYEYSADGGTTWTPLPAENLAPGSYQVRVSATGGAPASSPVTITIEQGAENLYDLTVENVAFEDVTYGTQPAAQNIALKNTGNSKVKITAVTLAAPEGGEESGFTLTGSGTPVVDGEQTDSSWTIRPNAGLPAGTYAATVTVTYHGVQDNGGEFTPQKEDQTATATVTLKVNKQGQSAPAAAELGGRTTDSISVKPVAPNADGAAAEYSLDGSSWQDEPTFTGLTPGTKYTVYIRYEETGDYQASPSTRKDIYTLPTAPSSELSDYHPDYDGHKITVPQGYEYSENGGSTWTKVTDEGGEQIEVTPGKDIQIRQSEVPNEMPASDTATITIPAKPAAPTQVSATDETIKGKADGGFAFDGAEPEDYEYSGDGGSTWTPCTGSDELAPGDYQVRKKATGSSFESDPVILTVAASSVTLTVTFDARGGSAVAKAEGLSYGGKASKPTAPTRTNYELIGWYTEAACLKAWDFDKYTQC